MNNVLLRESNITEKKRKQKLDFSILKIKFNWLINRKRITMKKKRRYVFSEIPRINNKITVVIKEKILITVE